MTTQTSAAAPAKLSPFALAALLTLALACFALRTAHILFERAQAQQSGRQHQPFESEIIAQNLVEGRGYRFTYYGKRMPTANAPPGIVFALAGMFWTGLPEPLLIFRLIQAATSAAALVLTWALARRAFNGPIAWLAAILFILDINLSYTAIWIQETALNVLFTLLGLYLVVRLAEQPASANDGGTALNIPKRALLRARLLPIACGAAFGLGMLVRPTVASILLTCLYWLTRRAGMRPQVLAGIILSAAIVLIPWTLRNAIVFHRFIPVSQNLGLTLWYGNNPRAIGSQVDADARDLKPEGELLAALRAADGESEIDQLYRGAAWQFIRENPGRAFYLRLKCFAYFWLDHNYWLPKPSAAAPDRRSYPVPGWLFAGNVALVAAAAVSLMLHLRQGGVARLLLVAIAASCLTYTLLHADLGNRYRMQIEPLLLIYVSALLWRGLRWAAGTEPVHLR